MKPASKMISTREAVSRMRAVKARAERMIAKVLEGGVRVPEELRGTYLDTVWRGVREAGWPDVVMREREQAAEASAAERERWAPPRSMDDVLLAVHKRAAHKTLAREKDDELLAIVQWALAWRMVELKVEAAERALCDCGAFEHDPPLHEPFDCAWMRSKDARNAAEALDQLRAAVDKVQAMVGGST